MKEWRCERIRTEEIWRDNKCATLGWLSIATAFGRSDGPPRRLRRAVSISSTARSRQNHLLPMRAVSQTDTVPFVRVPWNDPATIMRALDLGAYGMCPWSTPPRKPRAVAACRYSPVGMRSVGPVRGLQYGGGDYVAHANDEIIVMAMIFRPRRSLANLEAICATPVWTRSISSRRICRWLWAWRRAPTIPTRCTWNPRQDPRHRPSPRHQGGDALRRRRFRRRRGQAWLRHGHADLRLACLMAGVRQQLEAFKSQTG